MLKKPVISPEPKPENYDAAYSAKRLNTWFPELSETQHHALITYLDEMVKSNKAINLIAGNTVRNADSIHIGDAVLASRLLIPKLLPGAPLYDLGSGSGIPGIVIALLNPGIQVVLVDRDQRKIEFCKHVASKIGIKNLSFELKGIEDFSPGSVKNSIARGLAPFAKALINFRKQVPKGGRFFHMKSDGWANELAALPSQVFSHWTPSVIGQYKLPDSTTELFLVLTEKMAD